MLRLPCSTAATMAGQRSHGRGTAAAPAAARRRRLSCCSACHPTTAGHHVLLYPCMVMDSMYAPANGRCKLHLPLKCQASRDLCMLIDRSLPSLLGIVLFIYWYEHRRRASACCRWRIARQYDGREVLSMAGCFTESTSEVLFCPFLHMRAGVCAASCPSLQQRRAAAHAHALACIHA